MDYVAKYPTAPRKNEVEQFNSGRIYVYFSGIDNTPVFDSKNTVLPEKLSEYKNILKKYEDTEFGKLLSHYLDLLKQENYIRTQKIEDYLESFWDF